MVLSQGLRRRADGRHLLQRLPRHVSSGALVMAEMVLLKLLERPPRYRLVTDREAMKVMRLRGRKGLDSAIVGVRET